METSPEQVVIVDTENSVIGSTARQIMREQGLIHRACYILVFNKKNELFVQKRTETKDIYPGYYDIAAGGVVLAGESYLESAVRELAEELGISDVQLTEFAQFFYEDGTNRVWGCAYTCTHEGPFVLQKEEVESGEFLSEDTVRRMMAFRPFTPDGVMLLKRHGWLAPRES